AEQEGDAAEVALQDGHPDAEDDEEAARDRQPVRSPELDDLLLQDRAIALHGRSARNRSTSTRTSGRSRRSSRTTSPVEATAGNSSCTARASSCTEMRRVPSVDESSRSHGS